MRRQSEPTRWVNTFHPTKPLNGCSSFVCFVCFVVNKWLNGMPSRLWRVLHRTLDLVANPRHAPRQAGGDPLRAAPAGLPLRPFRKTGTSRGLREPATNGTDVRRKSGGRAGLPRRLGADHAIGLRIRPHFFSGAFGAGYGSTTVGVPTSTLPLRTRSGFSTFRPSRAWPK